MEGSYLGAPYSQIPSGEVIQMVGACTPSAEVRQLRRDGYGDNAGSLKDRKEPTMRQQDDSREAVEKTVRAIKRKTRRHFGAEEKIRIV